MNLWGLTDDRVLVVEVGVAVGLAARRRRPTRVHLDLDVRPGGGEVPERQRAVAMEQDRDRAGVGQDPGHVRRRGERPDPEPARPSVSRRARFELGQIDPAVGVLADRDHVGDRLAPGQLVAVVLVGPDQDDRSLVGRDVGAQAVALVEAGRDAQLEDADEQVDRAGHPGAGEDHGVVVGVATDRATG